MHGPVVMKLNDRHEVHRNECEILRRLNEKQYKNFPVLYSVGIHNTKPYMILQRVGQTLEFYQMINRKNFSFKTVHQIGIQLLSLLEQIHNVGYVYNDLKPDNICVGNFNDKENLHKIKMIDFGLATKYLIKN